MEYRRHATQRDGINYLEGYANLTKQVNQQNKSS